MDSYEHTAAKCMFIVVVHKLGGCKRCLGVWGFTGVCGHLLRPALLVFGSRKKS
jgi:hypothetical protein